jgi:hypothetical protein
MPRPIDDGADGPEGQPWIDLDATVAITAHGLLSATAAIETALSLIRQRHTELSEIEFNALVRTAERQTRMVGGVLRDLVHGLPAGALSVLDELSDAQSAG